MPLTVSTPYKTNTVASVSGKTFVSNGTPFVSGDVGRFIRLTTGSGAGQIRRINVYTSSTQVQLDNAWDVSPIAGFTDVAPSAGDTWQMSYTLDDIDNGVDLVKRSDEAFEHVSSGSITITLTNCFVAVIGKSLIVDADDFKINTDACLMLGRLHPSGYSEDGGVLIDRSTGTFGGWAASNANGNAGDLHLYGVNVQAHPTGNPFWRLYRGSSQIVRFVDCDFSGNTGGRYQGTKSCILRCTFRSGNNGTTIGMLNPIAPFGLIEDLKLQNLYQALYANFSLGVGTISGPRFSDISNKCVHVPSITGANGSFIVQDYVQSELEAANYVITYTTTTAGNFFDFKQYIDSSMVDTSLAPVTDESRRVIRDGSASVVDNETTTSGSFSRFIAIIKRFPAVGGNHTWSSASSISYGPYEEAIASYLYQPQTLDLPLPVSSNVQFTMIPDPYITQSNRATVDAYTELGTLCQLYDRGKSWFVDNLADAWPAFGEQACTGDGSALDIKGNNLVLDPAAASVCAVDTGTNTITVKTGSTFSVSPAFDTLKNFGSLTIAAGVTVSIGIEADSDVVVLADLDQLTGTITLAGTSRLDLSGPGDAPTGSSASGTTVRVIAATSGDVFDFTAWTFASGAVFENASGQPITLKLSPSATVPTLTETSGTITLDNAVSIDVTAANLVEGSRYRLYNVTEDEEVPSIGNGLVGAGGLDLTLTSGTHYTVGDAMVLLATYEDAGTAKRPFRASFTAGTEDISITDSQADWTEYEDAGVDGGTVTECATDYANLEVEVDDPDDQGYKIRYAAFMVHAITTADGIRNWVGLDGSPIITYRDAGNAVINADVAEVSVINVKAASKLSVKDTFRLNWSDGVTRADAVIGSSIVWDNSAAAVIVAVGSAVLPSDITAIADASRAEIERSGGMLSTRLGLGQFIALK